MHEPITINCHFSLLNHHTQSTRTENRQRKAEWMREKTIYNHNRMKGVKLHFAKHRNTFFLFHEENQVSLYVCVLLFTQTHVRNRQHQPTVISSEFHLNQLSQRGEFENLHQINPLNAELNPICHLLALVGAHHILHVSRVRVNINVIAKSV